LASLWAGGDIFVTGRIKDTIIRAGRHLYPQEIEQAVANELVAVDPIDDRRTTEGGKGEP